MSFIEVKNVSKSYQQIISSKNNVKMFFHRKYQNITGVKNLNFNIEKGEIVGYIGPNGSGKSATIKILSGILKPDNGYCYVDGVEPINNRLNYVKEIGVMFGQKSQLIWDLPVHNSFELIAKMYDLDKLKYSNSLKELDEILNISYLLNKAVKDMSLGERMKCELVATFIHEPKLVFLDEPTMGIDIGVKKKIYEFIKKINDKKKTTIFITSHDLSDIENLCEKLIIINKGEIFFNDSFDVLFEKYMQDEIMSLKFNILPDVKPLEKTEIIFQDETTITVKYPKNQDLGIKIINHYQNHGNIIDFHRDKNSIEDVILKIYDEML